ncbi:MAG: sigma-70 family RNA polymerase sigma factor [Anaerolineae bacterium]|nr:sigma-70 family RNA polymerase sigma factor [Anaerolineae bacterium]
MSETILSKKLEAELVQRSQNDIQAFTELYEHYFPRVYKYVYYRVGERTATEDLVSTIFLKIVEQIDSYRERNGEFSPWLFRIAHNVVVDYYRKKARSEVPLEESVLEISTTRFTERQVIDQLSDEDILAKIALLGNREREIIGLKFGAGLGNSQIANLLNVSENHVAVILYRAMKKLRQGISEEGE